MFSNIPSLNRLINELKKWPGVGPRSAVRLASWLLKTGRSDIDSLCQALTDIKTKIRKCEGCFTLTEERGLCRLCLTPRSEEVICVVEEPFDIPRIEASGQFRGRYHVLHGTLSPLHSRHPEHLTIAPLMGKVKNGRIKEVILALDADLEGDMTALYLSKLIKHHCVKVSRLANGIPFGGDMDYIDEQTLSIALQHRVEI